MLERVPALPHGWSPVRADARQLAMPNASLDVVLCAFLIYVLAEEDGRVSPRPRIHHACTTR
jgi:hypothetical protein